MIEEYKKAVTKLMESLIWDLAGWDPESVQASRGTFDSFRNTFPNIWEDIKDSLDDVSKRILKKQGYE